MEVQEVRAKGVFRLPKLEMMQHEVQDCLSSKFFNGHGNKHPESIPSSAERELPQLVHSSMMDETSTLKEDDSLSEVTNDNRQKVVVRDVQ